MKRRLKQLLAATALLWAGLAHAEIESDFLYESLYDQAVSEITEGKPFRFLTNYDYVGKSKFRKSPFRGEKFDFSEADVSLDAVYYYNPEHQEGLTAGIGYTYNRLDWSENPYFDKKNFSAYNFRLGAFTKRACNWFWVAALQANLDTDHTNFNQYANYDLLLWGRYNWMQDMGIHFGFVAITGMKIDRIVPILGIDWDINEKWKLKLIFPIDMALVYHINEFFCAELAGRAFESRYRVGKNENISRGLFEYRNVGAEFGLTYYHSAMVKANIHAGYAGGSKLKISNHNHKDTRRLRFGGSPYYGAALELNF